MGRRNTPLSLENWAKKAPSAIYRASVAPTTFGEIPRPHPDLASASKVSPGGRMLMAFELAAVRDYFVEGHADQGAQTEPDRCETASARRPYRAITPEASDYESALALYVAAIRRRRAANERVEAHFRGPINAALENGDVELAVSILAAMPDTAERIFSFEDIKRSGLWDFNERPLGHVRRAFYTQEQAEALVEWQRADKEYSSCDDIFADFARERGRELLSNEGPEALTEFAHSLPGSITKAYMCDWADQEAKKAAQPVAPGMR